MAQRWHYARNGVAQPENWAALESDDPEFDYARNFSIDFSILCHRIVRILSHVHIFAAVSSPTEQPPSVMAPD